MLRCAATLERPARPRCDGSHQIRIFGWKIATAAREHAGRHNHHWDARALRVRASIHHILSNPLLPKSSSPKQAAPIWHLWFRRKTSLACATKTHRTPVHATDSPDGESSPATYIE